MPDYVIINGKTVIDANTDIVSRTVSANGTLTVGNSSVNTSITPTSVTVKDLTVTGSTTLGSTTNGSGSFNATGTANAVNATANNGHGVAATTTGTGNALRGTSTTGIGVRGQSNSASAVQAVSNTGIGVESTSTSNVAVFGISTSNLGGKFVSTSAPGLRAESSSSQAISAQSTTDVAVFAESLGASYGVQAISNTSHGIYAITKSTSQAGVAGVSSNTSIYGLLGFQSTYSFYGQGSVVNIGAVTFDGGMFTVGNTSSNVQITSTSVGTTGTITSGNNVVNGKLTVGITSANATHFVSGGLTSTGTDIAVSGTTQTNALIVTGTSNVPTQLQSDNTTKIASTAYVRTAIANIPSPDLSGYGAKGGSNSWTGTNTFSGTVNFTGGSSVTVGFGDGDYGTRYIHHNSGLIGFLNTAAGWSMNVDNNGNVTATGDVTAFSDIKLKKNLEKIENALDKIDQLTGYTYDRIDINQRQTGLVAQDVQKVLPEAVSVQHDETLAVAYGQMMGLIVEAIKELRAEIKTLKGE